MNQAFIAAAFLEPRFNCPYCGAFAGMDWQRLRSDGYSFTGITMAVCSSCNEASIWHNPGKLDQDPFNVLAGLAEANLVFPNQSNAPTAHSMMPTHIKQDYDEARSIFAASHRSAAALLRLSLQKLCEHLIGTKGNINEQIKLLVSQGLPVQVQQALDAIRVIGNNAVHPGELNVDDKPEMVWPLFGLLNMIVENCIAQPEAIKQMYAGLPPGALSAIEKRDAPAKT